MGSERCESAKRLLARLAASSPATAMYQTEALYHAQIGWTLNLLDVVDEAADPVIAAVITDLIYERLAGDGGAEAAARMREAQAEHERLRQPAGFPPGVSSA